MRYEDLFEGLSRRIWSMLYLGALGLLFLAGVSGNSKPVWAQSGPTNIDIGTTVQQPAVKRLGINLSGQLYYDSAQILRNITFNNPGFESQMWQSVLVCREVSGTTCTDQNGWSQWPANFLQGGTYTFIYGAANGQTGTLASMTQASGNGGAAAWYDFGTVKPSVGDTFIIKKTIPGSPDSGWWTNTSGGATVSADTTDLSPNSPGQQAISLNASGSGQSVLESSYFDSTNGRSFLQLKGTYTITFRAKAKSGSNQLNVSVGRFSSAHGNVSYFNQNIALTNQWQDYSYTFTADEDGTYVGTAFLHFSVAGGTVLLDDAAVTESAGPGNTTAFRDAVVDRLKELNPGVLRYMDSGIDFGSSIDNMIAVPGARLRTGFGQGSSSTIDVPMGLEEFLVLCQAIGAEPWYTMPMGTSPTEAQNLIQFLGGDASTPYGAKRAALGQSAPWTSVFPTIHLELGDEAWNTAFSGDTIYDPYAYGSRVGMVFGAAKASTSYDPSKFDLILDGQATNTWFGQQAMNSASNNYDTVDAAPYTFYTFNDYSSNEAIYGSMFAQAEGMDSQSTGIMYQQMQMASGKSSGLTGKPAKLAAYEVNLSTVSGTAPQSVINSVIPSLGAGLSVAEHMLLMMRDDGVMLQTMFALPGFQNGFSNTNGGGESVQLWGTVVDMGGQTNCSRPQFLAEELANTAIGGSMMATNQSGGNPTWSVNSTNDTVQGLNVKNAHYIQSFAFVNGTENSLVLFNLSRSSALPVTFSGVNAPSGLVQVGLLTSANLTDTNENGSKVTITNSTIQDFSPSATTSLPPYSMTVYQWSTAGGVTKPGPVATTTAITATPASVTLGQPVTVTATVAPDSGSSTPTGNVIITDGSNTIGTTALNNGQVSLTVSTLAVGSHSLTATYDGSPSDSGSTSSPVVVVVTSSPLISTTTAITAPSQVTAGQSISFTANVAAKSGSTPAGTVSFSTGTTSLGTANLSNGTAALTLPSVTLATGTYPVTATYSGNSVDSASTSAAANVKVVGAMVSTTTKMTVSANPVTAGQPISFTANVAAQSGSTPTGTVSFSTGTTSLGTANLSNGNAVLTLPSVTFATGTYPVTATYSGNSVDSASTSAAANVKVVGAMVSTTTKMTVSATQVREGQSITGNVTVTAVSGVTPTGSVDFYFGSSLVGTVPLVNGTASFTTNVANPPGNYQTHATYTGNSTDSYSSSSAITIAVEADTVATITSLTSSAAQTPEGSNISLTAAVFPQQQGTPATGTVTFYLGQTVLGTGQLAGGQAVLNFATQFAPGQYQLLAVYAGNATDSTSTSNALSLTISATGGQTIHATTTQLSTVTTQLISGQSVVLTSKVTALTNGPTPTGTIQFLLGQTSIGTGTLSGGIATLNWTAAVAAGTYQLTAVYAGNAQDSTSSSAPLTITIAPGVVATTTYLTALATQITQGQTVPLSVVVAPTAGGVTPQGIVNFYSGQTQIGSVVLTAGAANIAEGSNFAPGTYQLTAVYAGNSQDSASTSNAVTLTVLAPAGGSPQPWATASLLILNPQDPIAGQNMSLQAQVKAIGTSSAVTGTITIYLGQTPVGTASVVAGIAVITMVAPQAGSYTASASFTPQGDYLASQSQPIAFTVQPAPAITPPAPPSPGTFTLDLSSNKVTLIPAQTASLQVIVAAVQGYTGSVELSCAGLPAEVACNFSPANLAVKSATATSVLSLSTPSNTIASSGMLSKITRGILLPWDLAGIFGFLYGRKRLRGHWGLFAMLCLALLGSTVCLTGCGLTVNNVTQPYQVSVTATGTNQVAQTTTFTLYVTHPAATF